MTREQRPEGSEVENWWKNPAEGIAVQSLWGCTGVVYWGRLAGTWVSPLIYIVVSYHWRVVLQLLVDLTTSPQRRKRVTCHQHSSHQFGRCLTGVCSPDWKWKQLQGPNVSNSVFWVLTSREMRLFPYGPRRSSGGTEGEESGLSLEEWSQLRRLHACWLRATRLSVSVT